MGRSLFAARSRRRDVWAMNPAFLHEIQRLVVAQVCDCFDTVKSSAADALAEVLASYITEIGRAAHDCADVAGRTDVNIGDVLSALDMVGAKFQTIVRDAETFEVPFAHALPAKLQIKRLPKRAPAFREIGEKAQAHIPKFLPAFPDEHTLRRTAGELAEIPRPDREDQMNDVLMTLKRTAELTKRKRFGEFAGEPPGEMNKTRFELWETAVKKSKVSVDGAGEAFENAGALSREDVSVGLDATAQNIGAFDGGKEKSLDATSNKNQKNSFREHSNLSNADYDTVERLIRGKMSVFEAS